jgi:hypothetical protein
MCSRVALAAAQPCHEVPQGPPLGRPAALCRRAVPGAPSVHPAGRSKEGALPALGRVPGDLAAIGELHHDLCSRSTAAYLESCERLIFVKKVN